MKRKPLLVVSAAALLLGLATSSHAYRPAPPPPRAAFLVEYGTDLPGADIRPGFPVDGVGQCMNACADAPRCRAFTWVDVHQQPPRHDNARPLCWLKSAVSAKKRHSGMVSGIKQ